MPSRSDDMPYTPGHELDGVSRPLPSESKLKPCGWCGDIACQHEDGTGVPIGLYHCFNQDCPLSTVGFDEEDWNRRALPEGAARGWVSKKLFEIFMEARDDEIGLRKTKACSIVDTDDIPVAIIPIQEEEP